MIPGPFSSLDNLWYPVENAFGNEEGERHRDKERGEKKEMLRVTIIEHAGVLVAY